MTFTGPVRLLARRWLTDRVFELRLARPTGFSHLAGQRVRLGREGVERDYSLVNGPAEEELILCIGLEDGGRLSPLLAEAEIGSEPDLTGPLGYFMFRETERHPILVATGTGVAPFVSMVRAGLTGFTLLQGAGSAKELLYREELAAAAETYLPCLTQEPVSDAFRGRVTDYLARELADGEYDFYLCGRREMVRDATLIIDQRFPESLVHSEPFY